MRTLLLAALSLPLLSLAHRVEADDVFDRLKMVEKTPELTAPKNAAERRIVKRARLAKAGSLIAKSKRPKRAQRQYVKLRRTVEHYVASIVGDGPPKKKLVKAGFVPCLAQGEGRCVAVVGDSCPDPSEECEGMHLIVIVRVDGRRTSLDAIIGGGFYLATNQDDIEDLREAAP